MEVNTVENAPSHLDPSVVPLVEAPAEIARFIRKAYDSHDHGRSFVPRWSGQFLSRIIFENPAFRPDHALGAYIGDRIVGTILAQPCEIWVHRTRIKGAYGSWLAVSPEGARPFVAHMLVNELRERLRAAGAQFIVGVAYRSGAGVGLDFWQAMARAYPSNVIIGPDLAFWARVLDGRALAKATRSPFIRIGAHLTRMQSLRKPKTECVRVYRSSDFGDCDALFRDVPTEVRFAPSDWDLTSAPDAVTGPQTLVFDRGRGPEALVCSYVLPMEDAGPLRVGIVEQFLQSTEVSGAERLLDAALWGMKRAGACLALLPRAAHLSRSRLVLRGFVPYSETFKLVYLPLGDDAPDALAGSFGLPVR